MELISLTIDGIIVQAPEGTTVLEAAQSVDIAIPTLCHFRNQIFWIVSCLCGLNRGYPRLLRLYCQSPRAGMVVNTQTHLVSFRHKRMSMEILIAQHLYVLTCYPVSGNANCARSGAALHGVNGRVLSGISLLTR